MNKLNGYLQMMNYTFTLWSILLFDCTSEEVVYLTKSFWDCLNCGMWMYEDDSV